MNIIVAASKNAPMEAAITAFHRIVLSLFMFFAGFIGVLFC
jgi:hypothetical protein